MNLAGHLLEHAEISPDEVCLRRIGAQQEGTPDSLTYGELDLASSQLAQQLQALGVAPQGRVMVQVDKSLAAVVLYLAVLRLGAVFVPLNPSYTAREVSVFVSDAEPVLLVAGSSNFDELKALAAAETTVAQLKATQSAEVATAAEVKNAQLHPWLGVAEGFARKQRSSTAIFAAKDDDLAAILYTSGTTGRSKGAMLTHQNLVSNARALCNIWRINSSDVLVHVLPIFHVHGLFVALNTVLMEGAQCLFMERFDAKTAIAAFSEATVFMGVPTHYTRLLEEDTLNSAACRSMRLLTSGSAPLDPVTFASFAERTGHRILERYGMTEAGMITSNPYEQGTDVDQHGFAQGARLAGTVGFPLPGVAVELRSEQDDLLYSSRMRAETAGQILDAQEVQAARLRAEDTVGRLRVRGPNVFAGYWAAPDKTAEALSEDGWLDTGDLATVDRDGRFVLVGRSTDMIIVGGYNVYPREVEDCLLDIAGVAEAAVFGVSHPVMGEGVVACLVKGAVVVDSGRWPTDEDIRLSLEERLAEFKHPRVFEWLESLPRNAMGKVQKPVLKERFANVYGAANVRK